MKPEPKDSVSQDEQEEDDQPDNSVPLAFCFFIPEPPKEEVEGEEEQVAEGDETVNDDLQASDDYNEEEGEEEEVRQIPKFQNSLTKLKNIREKITREDIDFFRKLRKSHI